MTAPAESARVTALFVDDEPAVLRFVARALQGSPVEVLTASGAEEALALMRRRAVDVLISDIDMPGMTGIELIKLVRVEFPETLRMLLTGAGTMDRALAAINEGEVHRFLGKPFDAVLFRATMRSLIERILALRQSRDRDLRAARRGELHRWVEETFPGTLEVERNERGEVEIEPPAEDLELLDRSPPTPT